MAGHADALVTWNVRHFPGSASRPVGVHVVAPDEFLTGLVAAYPKAVVEALGKQSQRYAAPPISVDEILRRRTQTMPRFTAAAGAARVKLERS